MKVTVKHYLHQVQWSWEAEPKFLLYPFEMTGEQYALVREMDVELDIPDDFDPRPQQIAALEEQRKKAMADYAALVNMIDGKIASLKAIEHKVEA